MRRSDFSGEKECRGACCERRSRIVWRVGGVKMEGFWRLVIRRVFVGGEGTIRGGREVRSSCIAEVGEEGGEGFVAEGEREGDVSISMMCGERRAVDMGLSIQAGMGE